jgi:zinc transporter ZupT
VPAGLSRALIISAIAIAGVLAGVRLSSVRSIARGLVAFSGGILMGVAAFWVFPELAEFFGYAQAAAWCLAGFAAFWLTNKYIHPVCPSCTHTHDHDHCSTRLHGFAGPMLTVAAVHSFLDGWILSASGDTHAAGLVAGVVLGIAAHKLPEGLALGAIVRASLKQPRAALISSILAQALTIAGAAAELGLGAHLGVLWAHRLLALAAGSFLFLGYHAVHSEYQRGGLTPAFMPALTGVAGASMMRFVGLRIFNL